MTDNLSACLIDIDIAGKEYRTDLPIPVSVCINELSLHHEIILMTLLEENIDKLKSSRSPTRRSAAKKLRKEADPAAGADLLAALKKEVKDTRTWETQYQMIMALGHCHYRESTDYLHELAGKTFDATMIYVALGDALVRLDRQADDIATVLRIVDTDNSMFINGAFRAMAMLKMVPPPTQIGKVLNYCRSLPLDHSNRLWVLAAAPGWTGKDVETFISECEKSPVKGIADCAVDARKRKYRVWQPL